MSHEDIAKTFDHWAGASMDQGMEQEHGDVVRQVLQHIAPGPGQQVLDLGCGNGWATRLLAKAAPGAGAVGIDVSPAMIAKAEELHSFTIRARYEVGTFEDIPAGDAKFDRAFSMEALYYAVDLEKTFSEILRVLKPGGRFDAIIDHYEESPLTLKWREAAGLDTQWMGEDAWCAKLEAAGFEGASKQRVHDSRGAGDEADFEPSHGYESFADWVSVREAGSLWLSGTKPA